MTQLPHAQHAWEATYGTDDRGRPIAPRFHRLLLIEVAGAPTAAGVDRLESALRRARASLCTRTRRSPHLPRMGAEVV
jgi:hypothetical protein